MKSRPILRTRDMGTHCGELESDSRNQVKTEKRFHLLKTTFILFLISEDLFLVFVWLSGSHSSFCQDLSVMLSQAYKNLHPRKKQKNLGRHGPLLPLHGDGPDKDRQKYIKTLKSNWAYLGC